MKTPLFYRTHFSLSEIGGAAFSTSLSNRRYVTSRLNVAARSGIQASVASCQAVEPERAGGKTVESAGAADRLK